MGSDKYRVPRGLAWLLFKGFWDFFLFLHVYFPVLYVVVFLFKHGCFFICSFIFCGGVYIVLYMSLLRFYDFTCLFALFLEVFRCGIHGFWSFTCFHVGFLGFDLFFPSRLFSTVCSTFYVFFVLLLRCSILSMFDLLFVVACPKHGCLLKMGMHLQRLDASFLRSLTNYLLLVNKSKS